MAIEIQVNGCRVTITTGGAVGGDDSGRGGDDSGRGGDDSGRGGDDSGRGGSQTAGCCGPTVIGPIVITCGRSNSGTGGDDSGRGGDDSGRGGDDSGRGGDDSGRGGSGTVSCCCPTVIGPIVISPCSAGKGSKASGLPPSIAVVRNPSKRGIKPPKNAEEFQMQQQEEDFWCWAAVSASVHNFLDPMNPVTQGMVATPVVRAEYPDLSSINCTATPDQCNLVARLDDALGMTENLLNPGGYCQNEHLVFDSIEQWVNAGIPVCARIVWASGGAHFIALDGFRVLPDGTPQVHVQDPTNGPSFQPYDILVSNYKPHLDSGVWQDTYLVQE